MTASNPPAEAPIPTMGKAGVGDDVSEEGVLGWVVGEAGGLVGCRDFCRGRLGCFFGRSAMIFSPP